jgi:hypothetical protein
MKPIGSFLGEALLQIALARSRSGLADRIPGAQVGDGLPVEKGERRQLLTCTESQASPRHNAELISRVSPPSRHSPGLNSQYGLPALSEDSERRDFLAPLDVKRAWPEQTEATPTGEVFVDSLTGLPVSLDDLMDAL